MFRGKKVPKVKEPRVYTRDEVIDMQIDLLNDTIKNRQDKIALLCKRKMCKHNNLKWHNNINMSIYAGFNLKCVDCKELIQIEYEVWEKMRP